MVNYTNNIVVYMHEFELVHSKIILTRFTTFAKCHAIPSLAELPYSILGRVKKLQKFWCPGFDVIPVAARVPLL